MIPVFPTLYIAAGLALIGIGLIVLAVTNRYARKADPASWIDDRIAAERDPGRRTSWRMLRRELEEDAS